MSASRLLRILQTLPPGADDDDDEKISAFNTVELREDMDRNPRCTNPFLSNDKFDFWNNPQLETSIFGDELYTNNEEETFRKATEACDVPSDLFEESTRLYVDNNAIECDMPELIVCYKESDVHINGICIDDGTISIDKDNDHAMNGDDDDLMIEASLDTEFLKHNRLRPSSETNCCMDNVDLKSSVGSLNLQDVTDNSGLVVGSIKSCEIDRQPLHKVSKAEELGTSGRTARMLHEGDIEASVSFHLDKKKPNHHKDMTSAKHETRYVEGELSFSMAGVISELISCSRPIAFSGGVSARSDGSAASTRSFAFPTLETEYISSPARMGRAERRRLKKQRGWRQGLLCCKF